MLPATLPKPRFNLEHRPGTQDQEAAAEVLGQNCYRLPQRLGRRDVVIDIGANIGCFSVACLLRGASSVWAFEPDVENHHLLDKNLNQFIGAHVSRKAVWGKGIAPPIFSGYPEGFTACGSCIPGCTVGGINRRQEVPWITLDDAIEWASECGRRRIRLLKIDAEGAEYPCLYTVSPEALALVDEICGEAHEIGLAGIPPMVPGFERYDMQELGDHLCKHGFTIETQPQKQRHLILFWAKRKATITPETA